MTYTFTEIAEQLERSARNGTKAHLAPDLARALIESAAYPIITAERTKELVATWQEKQATRIAKAGSSSAPTGSTIVPSGANGASPGTIPSHVHAADEALASEEAGKLARQRRRGKPSRSST